ncbi:MAG: hypothetical protein U0R70_16635 [Solirubrobacteraceae bacterium]
MTAPAATAASAAAALALLASAAPAGAAMRPLGTIAISRPALPTGPNVERPVILTYRGPLPALRSREYFRFSMAGPGGRGCNSFGIGTGGSPLRPRLKSDRLDPGTGMEFPSSQPARWCAGRWVAQYQLFTPFRPKGGGQAWKPRRTLAFKLFAIR